MTPLLWEILKIGGPIAGQIIYMLLEYWLGKTNKVEAASVIELILNLLKKKS